jgi:acyl-CoA thioester hydrolase
LTGPAARGTLGAVEPTLSRSELLAAKEHVHRISVRYAETDQMGVVHHSNYALYLEEARTTFLRDLGCSYAVLEREGIGLAVRRMDFRFRAPARYDDEIVVHTRVKKLGAASVSFEYELERAEPSSLPLRIAEASTELACIDLARAERPPRPLPDALRALLEPML